MLKRFLSVLLSFIMVISVFTVLPFEASAISKDDTESDISAGISNNDLSVTGTNTLGNMLAAEYEANKNEIENVGSNIYSVEVEGKTARVDVRALKDAKLIVSIFDEEGKTMYGSGMTNVTSEDSIAELTLEIATMPQYFLIRAFLLDKVTNLPLCKQYENNYYTKDMQEFFAKTTDDFDEDKVLNLDKSKKDNFLVYNDDTIIIENNDDSTNVVTKADDKRKEYIIENIDDHIASLKEGDVFSYDFGDGNLLIIKIDTITITGTTAVIKGDELELQEAFDYIKIDTTSYTDDAVVDNSKLEDGITYDGKVEDIDDTDETSGNNTLAPTGWTITDEKFEISDTFKYTFAKDELKNPNESLRYKLSGSVSLKFSVNVKVFFDIDIFQGNTVEFSFTFKYKLGINLELELKGRIPLLQLGYFAMTPCPGFYISFTPSIVVEGKLTAKLSVSVEGQLGFKFNNGSYDDQYKAPTVNSTLTFEGELFIGLSLEPKIGIVADAATANMEVLVGFRIKGTMKKSYDIHSYGPDSSNNEDEKHLCSSCLDGELYFVCEMNFKLSIFNNPDLTWKFDVFKLEQKLSDFYYSFDTNTFGWTKCPNHLYLVTVTVLDPKHKPSSGVLVNNSVTTDEKGSAKIYLRGGENSLTFKKNDKEAHRTATISKAGSIQYVIDFEYPDSIIDSKPAKAVKKILDSGKCGAKAFYVFFSDGTLKIGGSGAMADYQDNVYHGDPPWYKYREDILRINIGNGITEIGFCNFSGCKNLVNVTIGSGVELLDHYAFSGCSSLKSIVIPSNVRNMYSSVFGGCTSLESVAIENCNIGSYAFSSCSSLKSVSIGKGVTQIDHWAFQNCTSLENIVIPGNVDRINEGAFKNCTSLKSVLLDEGITTIQSNSFRNCADLESINIPNSVTSIGTYVFDNCSSLQTAVLGGGMATIPNGTFNNCTSLIDVSGGNNIESVGEKAFYNCTNLTGIPNWNKVTNIESYAFYKCSNLNSLIVPDEVVNIKQYAFCGCSNLQSVVLGKGLTTIGNYAFCECNGIMSIIIPDSVTSIGSEAFASCKNLESLSVLSGSIGSYAFSGNEKLSSVSLGTGVTSISKWAFQYCYSLERIMIPGSVENIEGYTFKGCSKLTSVKLENGVKNIASSAFQYCSALESIVLPVSVESIGSYVFSDCKKLKDVYYSGSEEDWAGITIGSNNAPLSAATIHYLSTGEELASVGMMYYDEPADDTYLVVNRKQTESPKYVGISGEASDNDAAEVKDNTIYRDHLVVGSEALLLVLSGNENTAELNAASIVYIAQLTVNAEGVVEFNVADDIYSKDCIAFIFGECDHSYSSWIVSKEADDSEEELKVLVCDHCGVVLDTQTIEGLPPQSIDGDIDNDGIIDFEYKVLDGGTAEITKYTGKVSDIKIPDTIDGHTVTRIGDNAFSECKILVAAVIPNTVTYLGSRAFYKCDFLKEITIPESVTEAGQQTFTDCTSLTKVVIPQSLKIIPAQMFYRCSSLKTITVPDTVTRISIGAFTGTEWYNSQSDGVVYIADFAYDYKGTCPASVSIMPGTKGVADYAFYVSRKLETIMIPDSVKSIGRCAFEDCDKLSSVDIPDSVNVIGDRAFYGCVKIKQITVPLSVTSIGQYALGYYDEESDDGEMPETSKITGFTINGYSNTVAERYAEQNGFRFESLGENPIKPVLGDVDGDGEVTIIDATTIQRHLASLPCKTFIEAVADTDEDEDITILDATAIQRNLAGLPTNGNIGKPIG